MKLTIKTKPKRLTLGQMYSLYLTDTGVETAEFIISLLDLCYPNKDRDSMNVFDKMTKYREAKVMYSVFVSMTKGMVGNG